jgi:hypothetical protein
VHHVQACAAQRRNRSVAIARFVGDDENAGHRLSGSSRAFAAP